MIEANGCIFSPPSNQDLAFLHNCFYLGEKMAFPTSVNSQITDSVTQANLKVLGEAPAMAIANLYQATAQALANAAHNAASAQQQANILAQAVTAAAVTFLTTEPAVDAAPAAAEAVPPVE
jgi:hypothetical protein